MAEGLAGCKDGERLAGKNNTTQSVAGALTTVDFQVLKAPTTRQNSDGAKARPAK